MCIRDSFEDSAHTKLDAIEMMAAPIAAAIETMTASLINGCLLYTSDAADERSSVDLGGRRIIKKKKHRLKRASDTVQTYTTQTGQYLIEVKGVH